MTNTPTIQSVVRHHVAALVSGKIDEILIDYEPRSLVFTPSGPVLGLTALRELFTDFLCTLPRGSLEKLEILREDYVDNHAYLLWEVRDLFPLGTDTYVVENGKILMQSFAAYSKE